MPAVINRATWCLDMETLLRRLPSLQGERAPAPPSFSKEVCFQGAKPAEGQGSLQLKARQGPGPWAWVGASVSMPTEANRARLV